MSETVDPIGFLQWLNDQAGIEQPKLIPGGRYAGLRPMLFTWAICVAKVGDFWGIDRQWCYHDRDAAELALAAWDGTGEPIGWHRDPLTGRRVSETGDELDENGQPVGEIGKIYVRP